MSDKHAYEAFGIRPEDGNSFTVEILGYQTEREAIRLAEHWAAAWSTAVDLYRVPWINTTSRPWAADEIQFVCRVRPVSHEHTE